MMNAFHIERTEYVAETVEELLRNRPVHLAVYSDDRAEIAALAESGVDLNQFNRYGGTAPIFAAATRCAPSLKMLLEHGVNINVCQPDGNTPLHCAVRANIVDSCVMLLAKGASIDARNDKGQTPLMLALENGTREMSATLTAAGASLNVVDNAGRSVLHLALKRYANADELRTMLVRGANAYALGTDYGQFFDDESGIVALQAVGIPIAEKYWHWRNEQHWDNAIAQYRCLQEIQEERPRGIKLDSLSEHKRKHEQQVGEYREIFDDRVAEERVVFARQRFAFIRQSAATICMALQNLHFPAFVSVCIIEESFLYTDCIPWHCLWDLAVTVKHLRD